LNRPSVGFAVAVQATRVVSASAGQKLLTAAAAIITASDHFPAPTDTVATNHLVASTLPVAAPDQLSAATLAVATDHSSAVGHAKAVDRRNRRAPR
jgi:hypothetical protein